MNWGRGLLRVWIVLSIWWIIIVGYACAFGVRFLAPWCVGYAHDPYAWQSAWPIHALAFGVPIVALVMGASIVWAANGFRS